MLCLVICMLSHSIFIDRFPKICDGSIWNYVYQWHSINDMMEFKGLSGGISSVGLISVNAQMQVTKSLYYRSVHMVFSVSNIANGTKINSLMASGILDWQQHKSCRDAAVLVDLLQPFESALKSYVLLKIDMKILDS